MRMTRAALRAQAYDGLEPRPTIHEDVDADVDASQNSNSEDSHSSLEPLRPVLKDITHENLTDPDDTEGFDKQASVEDITNDSYNDANDTTHGKQADPEDLVGAEQGSHASARTKKTRTKRKGKQNKKVRTEDEERTGEGPNPNHDLEERMEEQAREVVEGVESAITHMSSEALHPGEDENAEVGPALVGYEETGATHAVLETAIIHQDNTEEQQQTTFGATVTYSTSAIDTVDGQATFEDGFTDQYSTGEGFLHASEPEEDRQLQDLTSTYDVPLEEPNAAPEHQRDDPPKTPKFDPSIHQSNEESVTPVTGTAEDSFIDKIKSRSPSKMPNYPDPEPSDCFVEEIMTRTLRIEDSVEAIDALEDAIEQVSENLPVLEQLQIESPIKSRKNTPLRAAAQPDPPAPTSLKKVRRSPVKDPEGPSRKITTVAKSSNQPKSTTVRAPIPKPMSKSLAVAKQPKKPIVDGNKPRESSASTLPTLSFSNSPSKAPSTTSQKRVPSGNIRLSTNKPAFVPARSTKPPTRSTFSLPGEAISAKLKAQREERLKREEEAEKERKQFKARPVPTKASRPSVLPRENKASQARMSLYATGVNKENIAPNRGADAAERKPRPSSFSARPVPDQTKANPTVRRATSVAHKPTVTKPRVSSLQLAAGQKSTVTKDDAVHQKAKGREVFSRSKAELEQAEKERKEKEEATKKARAEAAERGRQASREWAEKQKKKMALLAAAKNAAASNGKVGAIAV